MDTTHINLRYSQLSQQSCCLSCGGAVNYANARPGENCVDLGSGKGNDAMRIAEEVGPYGKVTGIDISEGMLDTASKTAAKLGYTNIEFLKADLEELPLNENSNDLVISNCTINHASDKSKVWNEIYRILKPGGRFIVSDIYSAQPVPEEYKNDPTAVSECWAGAVTKEEYLNTLVNTGFINITILEETKPYEKGLIMVSGFTIFGLKPVKSVSCSCEKIG